VKYLKKSLAQEANRALVDYPCILNEGCEIVVAKVKDPNV
jgi:hypothetical protein